MMEEDVVSNLAVRIKLRLTVWEFIIPVTPSLPAVIGVSDTVIEDRFGVEHGSEKWYEKLDLHFKWLLQYRISPYFCRWGESMRVLTYTSPWPGIANPLLNCSCTICMCFALCMLIILLHTLSFPFAFHFIVSQLIIQSLMNIFLIQGLRLMQYHIDKLWQGMHVLSHSSFC